MAEIDVVHAAIVPPAAFNEQLVRKVAAIIGKTAYETRFRLTGKIPKIIANYSTRDKAELAAGYLKELGLTVMLFPDSELRQPWRIFKARSLKFEEPAIAFRDKSGQEARMEAREAFLIVSARMQAYADSVETKTTRKINIAATVLAGGIPIMKKVKEKTTTRSFRTENFVRVYGRSSPEPAVQIQQHDFDYSFLGTEMVASAATNFNIAIRKIREAFPQAIYDDRLMEPFGADMPATMAQDAIEANCKLLYWYHRAVSNTGNSAQAQQ
jgi:hypothetical protein